MDVGGGLVALSVGEDPRMGATGVRVRAASALADPEYDLRAGCRTDVYASTCRIADAEGSTSPSPGVGALTRYSDPELCASAWTRVDPKQAMSAGACGPGRVYPVPWGRCVRVDVYLPGVLATGSERCLLP